MILVVDTQEDDKVRKIEAVPTSPRSPNYRRKESPMPYSLGRAR